MSRVRLISICELLENDQGNPTKFLIPSYQRGYRWKKLQVRQLLDDIWEFIRNPQGPFYCLQPLVVKKTEHDCDFEVVDGQQRLTTIRLILSLLKIQLHALEKQPFEIRFETRKTESFLNEIDKSKADKTIDNYYIYEAHGEIIEWFKLRDSGHKLEFLQHLLHDDSRLNVRVIWYELSSSDDPVQAFTRLNIGKIPLTNDELIRATFLKSSQTDDADTKIFQTNLAIEWERFESELQNDEFWYFLNNHRHVSDNRIGFLFSLVLNFDPQETIDRDPYSLFYDFHHRIQDNPNKLSDEWKRIREVFFTLQEWFVDKRLFHMIGFLIHQEYQINDILNWSENARKSEFDRTLVEVIFAKVFGGKPLSDFDESALLMELDEQISDIEYREKSKVGLILLLFNLVTLIENTDSTTRFSFDKFKKENWDIEHVRSIASARLGGHKTRVEWLTLCLDYLNATNRKFDDPTDIIKARIEKFIEMPNTAPKSVNSDIVFERLYDEIRNLFRESDREEGSDDSIGNLVLLDRNTNRAYKNAVFAVKRSYILSLDVHGTFVPLCTRNVFLKCYSKNPDEIMFWSEDDERDYQVKMVETLFNFFTKTTN